MKVSWLLLFAFCCVVSEGFIATRAQDPRCEELNRLWSRFLEITKEDGHRVYALVIKDFSTTFNLDINDDAAMKVVICKIANAKTLRGLYDIIPAYTYEFWVSRYLMVQNSMIGNGGYTNMRRLAGGHCDFIDWIFSTNTSDPTDLKTKCNLTDVIDFVNVMQVKYGSRWLALVLDIHDRDFVIKDPEEFAKDMFDSTSKEDFVNRTSMPQGGVDTLWRFFRFPRRFEDLYMGRKNIDFIADVQNTLGELGLFNLKY